MQIVIDIPDNVKAKIEDNINACDIDIYDCVMIAVKNGTPLPKGRWRLIDVIQLKAKMFDLPGRTNGSYWDGVDDVGDLIDNAPTIVEADGAEE